MLVKHKNAVTCENPANKQQAVQNFITSFDKAYEDYWQIKLSNTALGIQTHKIDDNHTAIHILNYNYNQALDKVESPEELIVNVNQKGIKDVQIHALSDASVKAVNMSIQEKGSNTRITLANIPSYIVLELRF